MGLGREKWANFRKSLIKSLAVGSNDQVNLGTHLINRLDAQLHMPFKVTEFTDFYAGRQHATNVGTMFRGPENALPPNWLHIPIGYNGRASSVVISGTEIFRPRGQLKGPNDSVPYFGLSKRFDFELELGAIVGNSSKYQISVDQADANIFGYVLLNDWSARDIQAWEYQPLGPFLAKSFASHISPWVVTMEALAPFRCGAYDRPDGDPTPLAYLASPDNEASGGFDVQIEVSIASAQMREARTEPHVLAVTNMQHLYWTIFQMLTHHTSNGCNVRPGDMMGTGTISGPTEDALGSILEITKRGAEPVSLPNGEERKFLADGDELIMRAWCEAGGARRIGFGDCRAVIEGA